MTSATNIVYAVIESFLSAYDKKGLNLSARWRRRRVARSKKNGHRQVRWKVRK